MTLEIKLLYSLSLCLLLGNLNASEIDCSIKDDANTSIKLKNIKQNPKFKKMQEFLSTNVRIVENSYKELQLELSKQERGYYLKNSKELLSILSEAVVSQEKITSHYAALSIYYLSMGILLKRQGNRQFLHYPNIGKSKELRNALFKAVSNGPNKETKKFSAASLAMGFNFDPCIEKLLITEFQRTEHSEGVRDTILSSLGQALKFSGKENNFYYDTTLPIIINTIKVQNIIGNAAVSIIIQTKSKEALPELIKKLRLVHKRSDYRGILVALEKQKHNAKKFVPELHKILTVTKDLKYRTALEKTIKSLKAN